MIHMAHIILCHAHRITIMFPGHLNVKFYYWLRLCELSASVLGFVDSLDRFHPLQDYQVTKKFKFEQHEVANGVFYQQL